MYSNERAAQLILALLKSHGIRKVIASPGNTNFGIVGSMQQDEFFEMISSVDERSAAYMACGLSATCREPVVLSCTGATASREYLAGLTEAYYRKLPIVAITSFNGTYSVGQLLPQNIDRRISQSDVKVYSVDLPVIKDGQDERYFVRKVNEALLACQRNGGGPVHINVTCDYEKGLFETRSLPSPRVYRRFMPQSKLPDMSGCNKIAVFIGAHLPMCGKDFDALERFALTHNAVVLVDHTSNYSGAKSVLAALVAENSGRWSSTFQELRPDLIIDMGETSADYVTTNFLASCGVPVWRVSPDGELRDRFNGLTCVFEMEPWQFFEAYSEGDGEESYYDIWARRRKSLEMSIPPLPFTNRWIASRLAPMLPSGSILHMAILNSLRSWDYFEVDKSIQGFCNTGGFGIDGCMSTAIGSALADQSKMNYLFMGDLAFFYDMNSLGNRSLPANLRILVINNGRGVEFHMPYSPAAVMGHEVDDFVAAAGHFRNGFDTDVHGPSPIEAWCVALGVRYMRAANKDDLECLAEAFVLEDGNRPIVLECIVNHEDEVRAAEMLASVDHENAVRRAAAKRASSILPDGIKDVIKKVMH